MQTGGWPRLLLRRHRHHNWVPRSFAVCAKGRVPRTPGAPWIQFTGVSDSFTVEDNQNETGTLDDFMYRRYSPTQGRWISPDPAGLAAVNLGNPQSWNRYAYVQNMPLNSVDPLGLYCPVVPPGATVSGIHCSEPGDDPWFGGGGQDDGTGFCGTCGPPTLGPGGWGVGLSGGIGDGDDVWGEWLPSIPTTPGQAFGNILALSLPTGLNCPQVGGISSLICGGVSPIMDAGNGGSQTPKICGGTFSFGGMEADAAEAGAFTGVIYEHDSIDGNLVGNLTEVWGGGEVVAAGGGKITSPTSESVFQGLLGFVGASLSAGPLAGIQVGYAGGNGWGGLYVEGHLGQVAWGGGGYLRTSCNVGG